MDELNEDFLEGVAGEGLDSFRASDLPKPFIKVAQQLSHEVDKNDPAYIPGLEAGDIFNSLTKENYGKSIRLIVVHYEPKWLVYEPNNGPFKGQFTPGSIETIGDKFSSDKNNKLKVKATGDDIVDAMVFYVLNADKPQDGLAILTMYSSAIRHGQQWAFKLMHSVLSSGNPAPIYAYIWKLESKYNSNDKGKWYTFGEGKSTAITNDGQISKELFISTIKPTRQLCVQSQVTVNYGALLSDETGESNAAEIAKKY